MIRLILLIFFLQTPALAELDASGSIFFPEKQAKLFETYQGTPVTWWNFVIYDSAKVTKEEVCQTINTIDGSFFLYNPCNTIPINQSLITQWADQKLLSNPPPSNKEELTKRLNRALIRLSLPLPIEQLDIVRQNPLTDLQEMGKRFANFYKQQSSEQTLKIIPLLFNFSPNENLKTANLSKQTHSKLSWMGPHFGQWLNKKQIMHDLKTVGSLASFLFFLLFMTLWRLKKTYLLFMIPILGFSGIVGFILTQFYWGSIHGLTIAFGSGLIGIAVDYAFHGWKKTFDPVAWKSNLISFCTTIFAFITLSFLTPPLIKQISLFAGVGLSLSFLLTYLFATKFYHLFDDIKLPITTYKWIQISPIQLFPILFILLVIITPQSQMDFSMDRLDSTRPHSHKSFQPDSLIQNKDKLAFIFGPNNLTFKKKLFDFINNQKNNSIGELAITGDPKQAENNKKLWIQLVCDQNSFWNESLNQKPFNQLFKSLKTRLSCSELNENNSSPSLFNFHNQTLSIFKVQDSMMKSKLRDHFENSFFISNITDDYPSKLQNEAIWFLTMICLVFLIFLTYFFGKASLLCFIPSFGSLVSFLVVRWILDLPVTFMCFVGLLILMGLTLDYGVFCTSFLKAKRNLNRWRNYRGGV